MQSKRRRKKKGKRTFDIAMNDPVFVKKREGQQDFTDDEADVQFFQWLCSRLLLGVRRCKRP